MHKVDLGRHMEEFLARTEQIIDQFVKDSDPEHELKPDKNS